MSNSATGVSVLSDNQKPDGFYRQLHVNCQQCVWQPRQCIHPEPKREALAEAQRQHQGVGRQSTTVGQSSRWGTEVRCVVLFNRRLPFLDYPIYLLLLLDQLSPPVPRQTVAAGSPCLFFLDACEAQSILPIGCVISLFAWSFMFLAFFFFFFFFLNVHALSPSHNPLCISELHASGFICAHGPIGFPCNLDRSTYQGLECTQTNTRLFPRRRSNSQRAWTQGTNPITQRSSYTQQNGNMSQKQSPSPRPTPKESNTPDNHAHDRLVFLVTSFIVSLGSPFLFLRSPHSLLVECSSLLGFDCNYHHEKRGQIYWNLFILVS